MLRVIPLDRDASGGAVTDGSVDALARACDAVVLRASGLPDTLVYWKDVPKIEVDSHVTPGDAQDHALLLEEFGARIYLARSALTRVSAPTWRLPFHDCGSDR
jgi:hypothetical protein